MSTEVIIGIITLVVLVVGTGGFYYTIIKWLKDDINWLKGDIKRINNSIDTIKDGQVATGERLTRIETILEIWYKGNSPLELTKLGEEKLKESGAKDYIDENIDKLCEEKFEDTKNDYEVYNRANEVIEELWKNPTDSFEAVKRQVYVKGMEKNRFITIVSIALQSAVCAKKGIPINKEQKQRTQQEI